jgi:hypothetical protein
MKVPASDPNNYRQKLHAVDRVGSLAYGPRMVVAARRIVQRDAVGATSAQPLSSRQLTTRKGQAANLKTSKIHTVLNGELEQESETVRTHLRCATDDRGVPGLTTLEPDEVIPRAAVQVRY